MTPASMCTKARRYLMHSGAPVVIGLLITTTPLRAQWFETSCQQAATVELQQVGQKLTEALGEEGRQRNPIAVLGALMTGIGGQLAMDRPIKVELGTVEATLIQQANAQKMCRVRARVTIGYTRMGVALDRSSSPPEVRRNLAPERIETNIAYDFVFAGNRSIEILESALDVTLLQTIALHAMPRNQADMTPEVRAALAQMEVQRRLDERQAELRRAEAERQAQAQREQAFLEQQRALLSLPPAERPRISGRELMIVRDWADMCWTRTEGRRSYRGSIRLLVRFNVDGTLASRPEVQNPQPDAAIQLLANSAVRDLLRCSAEDNFRIRGLPRERYAAWAEAIVTFDSGN